MEDCENKSKTRLSVQGRSAGDGMENAQFLKEWKTENKLASESPKSKSYPQTFISPPGKRKEPKFVPYEPYKAAVSPILVSNHKKNDSLSGCIVPQKAKSLALEIIKQNSNLKDTSLHKSKGFEALNGVDNCNTNHASGCADRIIFLEDKLSNVEKEKRELEVQFSIQTQVNADLKKMLVAALGEDMQMKVQYMTEDKAKLGKDVLFYVQQLTEQNEEIEKLSVECDVWKSKFEASSVIVKELALFKSASSHKIKEINQVLESLMREHEEIYKQQQISHNILHHIQDAFNPSSKSSRISSENDLLQITKEIKSLSNSIQSRLLGNSILDLKSLRIESARPFTPAENTAYEMLVNSNALPTFTRLDSCGKISLSPGLTACSIMSHTCSAGVTINFCNHCSGKTQLI